MSNKLVGRTSSPSINQKSPLISLRCFLMLFWLFVVCSKINNNDNIKLNSIIESCEARGFDFDLNEPAPSELDEPDEIRAGEQAEPEPEGAANLAQATREGEMESSSSDNDNCSAGIELLGGAGSTCRRQGQHKKGFRGMFQKIELNARNAIKKLPDYFNFDWFRRKFNRKYSQDEFSYRKTVFLSRCMEVFKSRVLSRLGQAPYTKEVNKFSDKSPHEIKQLFMSGPPIEFYAEAHGVELTSLEMYKKSIELTYLERSVPDANMEEFISNASLEDLANGDSSDSLKDQNQNRIITHESQANREIESILQVAQEDDEFKAAILDELEGRATETDSNGSLEELGDKRVARKPLPWPGQLKSHQRQMMFDLNNNANSDNEQANYVAPKLNPKEDYLNWSEHECFHTIYDQKDKCGKCYVMATTALAEFYKCSEQVDRIDKRKFSKEYVLDCAQKFKPGTIYGCKGGSMLDTSRFIALAGIYNIRGWKMKLEQELSSLKQEVGEYVSPLDASCPLNEFKQGFAQWGEIRVEINPIKISVNQWMEALQDGPIVASVQMPNGVETYKSGVHDGIGCESSKNWHTMILVGYGLDNKGIPYWRFRNSFGPDWGDAGHFNLAMSVPGACLLGGVRYFREPLENAD